MKIYVLVEVLYDCYRFQRNLSAWLSLESAKNEVPKVKTKYRLDWPVISYDEHSDKQNDLDEDEICHYWIQEMTICDNGAHDEKS